MTGNVPWESCGASPRPPQRRMAIDGHPGALSGLSEDGGNGRMFNGGTRTCAADRCAWYTGMAARRPYGAADRCAWYTGMAARRPYGAADRCAWYTGRRRCVPTCDGGGFGGWGGHALRHPPLHCPTRPALRPYAPRHCHRLPAFTIPGIATNLRHCYQLQAFFDNREGGLAPQAGGRFAHPGRRCAPTPPRRFHRWYAFVVGDGGGLAPQTGHGALPLMAALRPYATRAFHRWRTFHHHGIVTP